MRKLSLIAAALFFVVSPARADLTVNVVKKSATPTYVTTYSLSRIQALARDRFSRVTGLTKSEFRIDLKAAFTVRGRQGGEMCIQAADTRVTATIGHEALTVYIPREFPRGSCAFNAVLDHENMHVRINDDIVNQAAQRVAAMLAASVRRYGGAFCARTPKAAQGKLMRALKSGTNDVSRFVENQGNRLHGRIDTPAEYDRISRSCREWPSVRPR